MSTFAELGLLYVYLLLIILVLASGYMIMRWAKILAKWVENFSTHFEANSGSQNLKRKPNQQSWVKLSFLSASILLLSLFSLGVLEVLGVGSESHQHGSTAPATYQQYSVPSYYPSVASPQEMQYYAQFNSMLYQLNALEYNLKQNYGIYP